jgi:hypothetical protein
MQIKASSDDKTAKAELEIVCSAALDLVRGVRTRFWIQIEFILGEFP